MIYFSAAKISKKLKNMKYLRRYLQKSADRHHDDPRPTQNNTNLINSDMRDFDNLLFPQQSSPYRQADPVG